MEKIVYMVDELVPLSLESLSQVKEIPGDSVIPSLNTECEFSFEILGDGAENFHKLAMCYGIKPYKINGCKHCSIRDGCIKEKINKNFKRRT